MIKLKFFYLVAIGSCLMVSQAHAACTYNEAIMAFSNGNTVRGHALMKMAARDGDQRAAHYLVKRGLDVRTAASNGSSQTVEPTQGKLSNTQSEKLVVMDTSKSASDIN